MWGDSKAYLKGKTDKVENTEEGHKMENKSLQE